MIGQRVPSIFSGRTTTTKEGHCKYNRTNDQDQNSDGTHQVDPRYMTTENQVGTETNDCKTSGLGTLEKHHHEAYKKHEVLSEYEPLAQF